MITRNRRILWVIIFSLMLANLSMLFAQDSPTPVSDTEPLVPTLLLTETATEFPSVVPLPTLTETPLPSETPTLLLTPTASATATATAFPTDTETPMLDLSESPAPTVISPETTLASDSILITGSPTPSGLTNPVLNNDMNNSAVGILAVINRTAADVTALRTEISDINTNCISSNTYVIELTGASPYTITNSAESFYGSNGLPVIRCDITIKGNGKTIQRSGSTLFRIFAVAQTGKLTLDDVTIAGGSASETGGSGVFAFFGQLKITNNSFIIDNILNFASSAQIVGAGVYSYNGQVTIDNSTISNNSNNNTVGDGGGVGIVGGSLTMTATTLSLNKTRRLGGGLFFTFATSSTVTNTDIRNNSFNAGDSNPRGGGVYVQSSPLSVTNGCVVGNASISFYSADAVTNADNNWWGASAGPNTTGADTTNGSTNVSTGGHKQSAPSSCTQSSTPTPTVIPTVTLTPTASGYNCPCSLWSTSDTPAIVDSGNATPVEVGVKFRAAIAGNITGLRFYKGSTNTGTHIGHLWTSSGTLLATATFTGETASGWQTVSFSTAVAIAANTTYIASYHTTSGRFSYSPNYFTTARVNGPLTAPDSTSAGGNGVYTFGASGSFPSSSSSSPNVWVDVIFSPAGGPAATATSTPIATVVTPTATATSVSTFKINVINHGTGSWSANEQQAINAGVNQVGIVFDYLATTVNTPQTAFNLVMIENSGTEILFIRTNQLSGTVTITGYQYLYGNRAGQSATFNYTNVSQGMCISFQEGIIGSNVLRPAAIICNGALTDQYSGTTFTGQASVYTVVHELGHIFDYRTTYGISAPINNGIFVLVDCDGSTIMGVFNGNWTRGRRGWGTGPAQYLNPSGNPAPLITDFQQNSDNIALETAADSFLNWVARLSINGGLSAIDSCTLTPRPPYNQWSGSGFLNRQWSATPHPSFVANSAGIAGTPDAGLPGDRRYWDIDVRVRQIFSSKGW